MKKKIVSFLLASLMMVSIVGMPIAKSEVRATTAPVYVGPVKVVPPNQYWNYSKTNLQRVSIVAVHTVRINGYVFLVYSKVAYYRSGVRTWTASGYDLVYAGY